jgi:hypothetical protein
MKSSRLWKILSTLRWMDLFKFRLILLLLDSPTATLKSFVRLSYLSSLISLSFLKHGWVKFLSFYSMLWISYSLVILLNNYMLLIYRFLNLTQSTCCTLGSTQRSGRNLLQKFLLIKKWDSINSVSSNFSMRVNLTWSRIRFIFLISELILLIFKILLIARVVISL